jgi:beta-glucosidase
VELSLSRRRDDFVSALMADMSLSEKIGQLNLVTPGGDTMTGATLNADVSEKVRAGKVGSIFGVKTGAATRAFQDLAMQSRLRVPLMFAEDVIHGHRTIFPIPLALAASFDMALVRRSARLAAIEAAAGGIDQVYAPMIDVCRDPRWGRIAESPGEDPFLAARYAEAMVHGFQDDDLTRPDTVMACLKHFLAYGAPAGGRDYAGVDMSAGRLTEVYLPPFAAAVAAGAGSVMAGFNALNGMPMHANRRLIGELLRGRLGFEGLVVADYTGVAELVEHGVAADMAGAARRALAAGVDLDMVSEAYLTTLEDGVRAGKVPEAEVNDACRRVLEAKWRLGLFADPYRRIGRGEGTVIDPPPAHRAEARAAVASSLVLLKNDGGVLPMARSGTVALVGPLADDRVNLNGTWSVNGRYTDVVTIRAGLEASAGNAAILHARGADIVEDDVLAARLNVHDGPAALSVTRDERGARAMLDEAEDVARRSDVIVAVVGEAREASGESSSRTDLRLPEGQMRLLRRLKETGRPLVVVVMCGRPLVLGEVAELADALVIGFFGGSETGNGIADVMWGAADPGGRLPATFPADVGQIPVAYDEPTTGRPWRGRFEKFRTGYLDLPGDGAPDAGLYPFGSGLSYTRFDYAPPQLEGPAPATAGDGMTIAVRVRNAGERAGTTVVQAYAGPAGRQVARPRLRLVGFEKLALAAGEERTVRFTIHPVDFAAVVGDDLVHPQTVLPEGPVDILVGPDTRSLKSVRIRLPETRVAAGGMPT